MTPSQRTALLVGAVLLIVGLALGLVPVTGSNNVASFDCGPVLAPRDFAGDQFCQQPLAGRQTLVVVLVAGGLAVAAAGFTLYRRVPG